MEQVRDLNMETDDMQVVLSAISGVSKRIKEVAQTHKPLFGGEHFLTGKEVCDRLYISPRTLQDYRDRRIIPYTQFAGKILYKVSDLERMLKNSYREKDKMRLKY
ncbi:helix-turn-helix domain-containing protein [Prevotella histicola]|uniref:helix-turn-helix domain-containing protein n=1 Tax=Prevotella histicola TaxID=470565 RepID=UPI0028E1CCD5|nr:helix-turn-helix domain-containing protein [Prevotella histicola]